MLFRSPWHKTEAERAEAAKDTKIFLESFMGKGKVKMFMDTMDDTLEKAYEARPWRWYIIDVPSGKIIGQTGLAPFNMEGKIAKIKAASPTVQKLFAAGMAAGEANFAKGIIGAPWFYNKIVFKKVQALLGGADQLKFGYVTRAHPRDNYNHVILGTQFYKPKDFAAQINLNVNNMWGILKTVVDMCMKLGEIGRAHV